MVDPHSTVSDLLTAFTESTTRLTLPFRLPSSKDIRVLNVNFGAPGVCNTILKSVVEASADA